jgi:hypothetical protein
MSLLDSNSELSYFNKIENSGLLEDAVNNAAKRRSPQLNLDTDISELSKEELASLMGGMSFNFHLFGFFRN